MPNWVDIRIDITGKVSDLQRLRDTVKGKGRYDKEQAICNDLIIPYPKEMAEADRKNKEYDERLQKAKERWLIKNEKGETIIDEAKLEEWHKANPEPKDGYNTMGGYDWCLENWGSKWGICDSEMTCDIIEKGQEDAGIFPTEVLSYGCQSPWGVPDKLFLRLSEMFPDVNIVIDTEEESNAFIGEMEWHGGKLIRDDTHEPTMEEIQNTNGYTDEEMREYYGDNWDGKKAEKDKITKEEKNKKLEWVKALRECFEETK